MLPPTPVSPCLAASTRKFYPLALGVGLLLALAGPTGASASATAVGPASSGQPGPTATITGQLTNLRGGRGTCYLALFASPAGFSRHSEQAVQTLHVPVNGPTCPFSFEHLPPGTYALAVYHDENGNGRLDTNFLGIPTERYGFSNDARAMMFFPPSFAAARFVVPAAGTTVSLRLK